jgi:heptosyltransferase-2
VVNPQAILFKGNNWLGDAILSLPTIFATRKTYPKAHITILTKSNLKTLYEMTPFIDEIMCYDGYKDYPKLASRLREKKFDMAMIFPRSYSSALLIYLAKIPKRIGYASSHRSLFLTDKVKREKWLLVINRVYYYYHLVESISKPGTPLMPTLSIDETTRKWALGNIKPFINRTIIGINPGAAYGSAKMWDVERFADVARKLIKEKEAIILVFGSPSDTAVCRKLTKLIGQDTCNFSGRTDIKQLAGLMSFCKVFISNDTGAMHLASALNIPIVAIFGPTDSRATAPFTSRCTIVKKDIDCSPCFKRTCPTDHKCMKEISQETVYNAVLSWL